MNFYEKILKILSYLTIFLVPIFFMPWVNEAYDFSKLYLFFFLISAVLIVWLAKMIQVDKKFVFYKTPMDLAIVIFAAVSLLSTYFSIDQNVSLIGFYGRFFPSLAGVAFLLIFYFLLVQNLLRDKILKINKIITLLFASATISIITAYGSIFNIWSQIALKLPDQIKNSIPSLFFQPTFNLTSASLEALSFFLVPLIVFLIVYWVKSNLTRAKSAMVIFLTFLFFGILVFTDFYLVWITMVISLLVFISVALRQKICRPDVNKLLLPIVFLLLSTLLLAFNPTTSLQSILGENLYYERVANLPDEILPNVTESYKASFGQIIEKPILGSGLGNYYYSFNKHRSLKINQGYAWQLRFDRPTSHFAEIIATQGALGILSYLFLIGFFLYITYLFLESATKNEDRKTELKKGYALPIIFTAITFIITQFFYYQNFSLAFGFWLFLALAVAIWQKPIQEKEFSFDDFPELALVFSVILFILIAFFSFFLYLETKIVLADFKFNQAVRGVQEPNFNLLVNVEKLNPIQAVYYLNDGRLSLSQALKELSEPENQMDSNRAQSFVARAIQKSRFAYDMSPNLINVCENLAIVYRDTQGLAQGADEWAKRTLEHCIEIEPNNPLLYLELGKMYFQSDLDIAKQNYNKAIEKKQDYLPSHIQYALVLEKEGLADDAISYLEQRLNDYPYSFELRFQVGRFHYNKEHYSKAIDYFKQAIELSPNYSNAIYSLGLAYEKTGDRSLALEQFKKVLGLNPDNEEVKTKISELERGVSIVEDTKEIEKSEEE